MQGAPESRSHLVLDLTSEIERATAELFRRDDLLRELCSCVKKQLGFDFVAVQLIDKEESTIQCVYGTNRALDWAAVAKHSLEVDPEFYDIQVDIALSSPPRLELISGQDPRFDPWIYRKFRHEELERVWVPIILARDGNGAVIDDWFDIGKWIHLPNVTNTDEFLNYRHETVQFLPESLSRDHYFERLGTVEAGVTRGFKAVTINQSIKLARLVASHALTIRKTLLPYVLRRIAHGARQIGMADSASLYCFWDEKAQRFMHKEYCNISSGKLIDLPPRVNGLGREAINKKTPQWVPDATQDHADHHLKLSNPRLYKEGIRSMIAFPLPVDVNNEGVLYLHYGNIHNFDPEEIRWVTTFANRAAEAIRHATYDARLLEATHRIVNLQAATQLLTRDPEDKDLLRQIAGIVRNVLAADVVTIYEYVDEEDSFPSAPEVGGRLRVARELDAATDRESPPFWLVWKNKDLYEEDSRTSALLYSADGRNLKGGVNFIDREQIRSTAGVLLRVGKERVGAMFLNYRRPHRFSAEEQRLIQIVASTAAVAIYNRRLIQKREVDLWHTTHQVRVPLRGASANLEMLRAIPWPTHELHKRLGVISSKIEDVLILSEGIFTALACDLGRCPELRQVEIEGPKEVGELWGRVSVDNGREDLLFENVVDPGVELLRISRPVFTSVCYSILHNATKYCDRQSEVKCTWSVGKNGETVLRVKGTGKPISPDSKEKVFKKFWRAHDAASDSRLSGVGMGLWMARELMVAVGGELTVELVPGAPRVSIFIVSFPCSLTGGDRRVPMELRV